MVVAGDPKLEQIRQLADGRGVEFFFAQFVDLYGRPSAKLMPAAHLDELVDGRRRVRRVRRRRDRPGAERPGHRRDARPRQLHARAVAAEPRALRLRRHRRGRGVAVLPAHDPAQRQLARAKELGYEFKIGLELEYFLVRRSDDGSIEIADQLDTLEKPCYDMARADAAATTSSRPSRGTATSSAGATTRTTTRTRTASSSRTSTYDDALVSCDRAIFFRYMVHTLAEQHGMIATFMPKPFTHLTGNGCHFHMSLWRDGDERLPRRGRPARARPLGDGLPLHRRAQGARARLQRAHRADRQLVQAAEARLDRERRDVVAGLDLVRLQQPHADAAHPGARADRGPHGRRLVQPVPRRRGRARRRASTGSRTGSTPGEPNSREPLRVVATTSSTARGLAVAAGEPARGDRRARAGRRAARGARHAGATRTTSTTTRSVKRDEWFRYHEQVTAWELARVPDRASERMCGIVGLFASRPRSRSGSASTSCAMLAQMSDRGPDSAGVAVYRDPAPHGLDAS